MSEDMIKSRKRILVFFILTTFLLISLLFHFYFVRTNSISDEQYEFQSNCSIFTVKDEDSVYFGNNEDEGGNRRRTDMWFVPSDDTQSYGCVYVGFAENEPGGDDVDGIEIGGMNTEGLCFDGNGIFPGEAVDSVEEYGPPMSYLTCRGQVLRECASVVEVIEWYQTHNLGGTWWGQTHWADKTGDAVVVSPATDGGIAFTRISGDYLISTNFNVDHPQGPYYPCWRYNIITTMLEEITTTDNVTVENCAQILDVVHAFPGPTYPGTVYSNVFDLKKQLIYLYIHGDYDNVVLLNLTEELTKSYHGYIINDLAESSPEELYLDSDLWPIEPEMSISSISVLITFVTAPIVIFLGYWIYATKRIKRVKIEGGKKDGD
jgi:hypothetical protein